MGIAFVTGTALFFTRDRTLTEISKTAVTAVGTVVVIYEVISGIKSTVFFDLFGNGRRVLA
jgi:hypothetical protein